MKKNSLNIEYQVSDYFEMVSPILPLKTGAGNTHELALYRFLSEKIEDSMTFRELFSGMDIRRFALNRSVIKMFFDTNSEYKFYLGKTNVFFLEYSEIQRERVKVVQVQPDYPDIFDQNIFQFVEKRCDQVLERKKRANLFLLDLVL